jgi:hypothetical protein
MESSEISVRQQQLDSVLINFRVPYITLLWLHFTVYEAAFDLYYC